ncbi:MAG: MotA/TolQ/ExbB proton channel family protein [Lachnospiraceae bacterium]|nr:MotA/TolQ/ExbB proton channel family protein [Lachnospiraceae bacterium]MEE3433072.1 MotA/TolQ/ExbB proton channel family protein [Lachnospiraceae bacterium]
MATIGCYKLPEFINAQKMLLVIMKEPAGAKPAELIGTIINLANVSRKEGLLALDEATTDIEDPFLRKGVMLVVDGTDPDLVRAILETEMNAIEDRHKINWGVWDKLGEMGPAWGMIGTLIGLINMLKDLSDAASIGPNMAVALITTLYGSILVNYLCTPISGKLQENNAKELATKTIVVEGLLSIQAGENPRVIEEKLKTFLNPAEREAIGGEGGEEAGGAG